MPRFSHPAVPIVLAAVAVDAIGFGIAMPVLPELITGIGHVDLAAATRLTGWMLTVYAVTQFVAGPVLGGIGDAVGRRPVLIAAMLAFAADYGLMAAAPSVGWLFVGRAIAGVTGATFGPIGAVLADVSPPERRARQFGYMSAAFGVGFIVGPALGGLVAGWGVRAPFWLAAGLAFVNALAMLAFLPETLAPANRRRFALRDAHVLGAFRPLFAVGGAGALLVAWFLWQVGAVVYPATWAFWAALRFGWGAAQIGLSLAWVGLLQLLVQMLLAGRVVARLGERGTAVLGLGCGAATMLAYAFVTSEWQVYAFFLVGCLGALAWPALNGILSRRVDASRQGALQGGLGSLNSVSAVIGPLIATQSLAWGSRHGFDGAAFALAAVLVGAAGLIVAWRVPRGS